MAKKAKALPLPAELSSQAEELYKVLDHGDDLACALIGATFVDHCLASMLQNYLVDGETSRGLLRPGAALGDFATRRQLCYTLGLISKAVSVDIERIGTIRNRFAHHYFDVKFSDNEVRDHCSKLTASGYLPGVEKALSMVHSPRSRFVIAVLMASDELIKDAASIMHRARKDEPPTTAGGGNAGA